MGTLVVTALVRLEESEADQYEARPGSHYQ